MRNMDDYMLDVWAPYLMKWQKRLEDYPGKYDSMHVPYDTL